MKKTFYEKPLTRVLTVKLARVLNSSDRGSSSPSMNTFDADDEDWGDWA